MSTKSQDFHECHTEYLLKFISQPVHVVRTCVWHVEYLIFVISCMCASMCVCVHWQLTHSCLIVIANNVSNRDTGVCVCVRNTYNLLTVKHFISVGISFPFWLFYFNCDLICDGVVASLPFSPPVRLPTTQFIVWLCEAVASYYFLFFSILRIGFHFNAWLVFSSFFTATISPRPHIPHLLSWRPTYSEWCECRYFLSFRAYHNFCLGMAS